MMGAEGYRSEVAVNGVDSNCLQSTICEQSEYQQVRLFAAVQRGNMKTA